MFKLVLINNWRYFKLAIILFTRLRLPSIFNFTPLENDINKAIRYFPLVGYILCSLIVGIYFLINSLLPSPIVVLLMLISQIILTGGLHEDGLADSVDGLFGVIGKNPEKSLAIMKDSNIGTYGVLSLILSQALRYFLLFYIINNFVLFPKNDFLLLFLILTTIASLSRLGAVILAFTLPYIPNRPSAKFNQLVNSFDTPTIIIALIIGILPMILLSFILTIKILFLLITVIIWTLFFRLFLLAKIDGYTGDCLGATTTINEILIMLVFVAIFYY